jgi:uncharacterized Zn finger protein
MEDPLLQGKLSDRVMSIVTDKTQGLFPSPKEIQMSCSCPDSASLCKHLAAVLYGIGARLDQNPGLLFTLRSVNQDELISQAATGGILAGSKASQGAELAEHELADVFGVEIDAPAPARPAAKVKQVKPQKAKSKARSLLPKKPKYAEKRKPA